MSKDKKYLKSKALELIEPRVKRYHAPKAMQIRIMYKINFSVLLEWAQHAAAYGEDAVGLVIRRERTQLVELIEESKRVYSPIGAVFNEVLRVGVSRMGLVLDLPTLIMTTTRRITKAKASRASTLKRQRTFRGPIPSTN